MSEGCQPLILGVTGNRIGLTFDQRGFLMGWLDKPFWGRNYELVEFHHGDCVGADEEVAGIIRAKFPDCKIVGHIPDNDRLRAFFENDEDREPLPYLTRNKNIVHSVNMLIAFPATMKEELRSGTWSTIRYAKKRKSKQNLRIGIFWPSGKREMI